MKIQKKNSICFVQPIKKINIAVYAKHRKRGENNIHFKIQIINIKEKEKNTSKKIVILLKKDKMFHVVYT